MNTFEDWAKRLASGLSSGHIPEPFVRALLQHLDPPIPEPEKAVLEIRTPGKFPKYYADGRELQHRQLLAKRFKLAEPTNSYVWLREKRAQVDEMILQVTNPALSPGITQMFLDIEEAYTRQDFPAKPLYEAFCLGRLIGTLETINGNSGR